MVDKILVDMVRNSTHLVAIVFFVLVLAHSTTDRTLSAEEQNSQDASKSPLHVLWEMGPIKIGAVYKESKLRDRLKLSKTEVNLFLAKSNSPSRRNIGKIIHREDLIRCANFLTETPEMESLIDCKPIEEQVLDVPAANLQSDNLFNYVKRTKLSVKGKLDLWPFFDYAESSFEAQFYPFKADFTEQNIKIILKQHNMEQGLGFDSLAPIWGFFIKMNLTDHDHPPPIPTQCTANLFISINQSEPIPANGEPNEAGHNDGQSKVLLDLYKHSMRQFELNGGFLSVQEAICETSNEIIKIESDFTLIHRKQFPFVTLTQNMITKPSAELLNYTAVIGQTKLTDETAANDAYNTSIRIHSKSTSFDNLNFLVHQNFTNLNFSAGSENMLLAHPILIGFLRATWTGDSLDKTFTAIPTSKYKADSDDDPRHMIIYSDKPENPYFSLTFVIDRILFREFLSTLLLTHEHKDAQAFVDNLMPHIREALMIHYMNRARDEL